MKITVDIPDSIEKELKLYTTLMLFKQGKISLSKASELAQMTIYDFIKECKKYEIPVVDYSKEELEEEFETLKMEML